MFLFICGLTTIIYPWQFDRLYGQVWWAIALLNLRNSLLVTLYVVLLRSGHAPCDDDGVTFTSCKTDPTTKSRERRSVS